MAEHVEKTKKQQTDKVNFSEAEREGHLSGSNKPTRRERKITFRLTESEYAQISEDIAVSGLSVSTFIRKRLLGVRIASRADLAVLSELRRLGGLLKHVHNETRGAYSALTAQAIRDLSACAQAITKNTQNAKSTESRSIASPDKTKAPEETESASP